MDNDKFQELVLQQLQNLTESIKSLNEGQARMETRIGNLEEGQKSLEEGQHSLHERMDRIEQSQIRLEQGQRKIRKDVGDTKKELHYVWDDIKKIDNRLTAHDKLLTNLN